MIHLISLQFAASAETAMGILKVFQNADLLQGREAGAAGSFAPPEKSLRLTQVTNYGEMILENQGSLPILPQPLRDKALALRGKEDYSKLWKDIAAFNHRLNLKHRGHLDELKRAHQPERFITLLAL